jgi:1,4-dihydroxy-2-naphthoyl-CoA hydrolase
MNKFNYERTIKFADTDAAGVVYFSNLLSICHEAYEAYLVTNLNLDLQSFFQHKSTAFPIIHANIDFFEPLYCGDCISIFMLPQLLNDKVFEIEYEVYKNHIQVAKALTRHICINPQTRETKALPAIFCNNMKRIEISFKTYEKN